MVSLTVWSAIRDPPEAATFLVLIDAAQRLLATRRAAAHAAAVLIVGVTCAILWEPTVNAFLHRERNRHEIRALYENLQPGMTKQQVGHVMDSGGYPHLQFYRADSGRWFGSAPVEFGAGNWVLVIEFLGDHVSALRVRTADSDQDHPAEAPPDRISAPR